MVKPPCCDKNKMQMGEVHWTEEHDAKTLAYTSKQGTGNWTAMPKKAGLRRCGKRWSGNQRPDSARESFTPEEEDLIIKLHAAIGSRWTIIAQQLPGRTDNDVKNIWNTNLKKKLSAMGIDPVTHRPFSQILADYGNIGGFPKARTRFGCLSRDIKNAFMMKSEPSHTSPERSSYFNSHFSTRTAPPEMEPSKHHLLSNCSNSSVANQSHDLLSQLQAIKMVTEGSNYTNLATISAQIPTECSSSSASSSSPGSPPSATSHAIASPSFSWCDFLLDDAFLPTNVQQQENAVKLSPSHLKSKEKQNYSVAEKEMVISIKKAEASTPSSTSFVEAMLEGENEMLSDFHVLLEEPFYY